MSHRPFVLQGSEMAKRTVNKSDEVRQYANANPDAKASEIVAALAKNGVNVKSPLVYNILAKARNGRKRGRKAAAAPSSNGNGSISVEALFAAKKLVDQIGLESAKEALGVLAKLA